MKREKNYKKVIIAMSGGVDSSVAAVLLKEAGFDVVGIMARFWKEGKSSDFAKSEKLAKQVAKKIGIPFYVVNLEKEFKNGVVESFIKEYKNGKTPNPCVVCNKEIKFGILMQKVFKMKADFFATGHYARIENNKSLPCLFKAKDEKKDQSYFLWQLSQKNLDKILFPIGGYKKTEVRNIAKEFDLPTAQSPESQEVCFISGPTNNFLKKYLKTKPGKIIDKNKKVLGNHNGLWFYTIGQRKGLEIAQGPWYVAEKDFKKNILIVSKDQKDLLKKELIAKDVNWILPQKLPINAEVKIRYKSNFAKAKIIKINSKKIKIIFNKPQKAITSGQSVVFYDKNKLLGGGIIL
jgi:tRNA-specific 2-thiouridylase